MTGTPLFPQSVRSCVAVFATLVLAAGCISNESGSRRKKTINPLPAPNPHLGKAFYEEPAGSRFRYLDNHGRYIVDLFAGGTHRFVTSSPDGLPVDEREGRWTWTSTGEKEGILSIDDIQWNLYFATPELSTAQTKGDVRTYRFEWQRLSSERKPPAAGRY